MKKIRLSFCVLLLIISLVGCSNNTSSETPQNKTPATTTPSPTTSADAPSAGPESENKGEGSNILIAYFTRLGNTDFPDDVDAISSASLLVKDGTLVGNTQYIANLIQQNVGGDLFLIETSEKYPADYDETVDQGKKENDEKARPALASHVEKLDNYDVIFLGFPNWWYDMPMAVYSFLDEYDLSGKTIVPFCTSGGSSFSKNIDTIKELESGATVLDGFTTRDSSMDDFSPDSVKDWLSGLDLPK
ncbi:MAG: hypothetical protein K0Q48_1267 [Bacillota bacterium]|jgi:flavodoxin|nr:hypothetical protein [Bacillota bacterium]